MKRAAGMLGAHGPLSRALPGFRPRRQQQEMADAIARAIETRGMLVAEAGTGTGKTFAYLAPALDSGHKTVVSTGTRALQDQLFHRDLPVLRRALESHARVALLKGRANYLCIYRLELAERAPEDDDAATRLHALRAWAERTVSGEISEFHHIPQSSPWWQTVTSTTDNCLGGECPAWNDCHVVKARRAAQEADLLVVNHHLLFSDFLLRQDGNGELLPEADTYVIDEAHQLPELATRFFGVSVSGRQIGELARDSLRALQSCGGRLAPLEMGARALELAAEELRRALGGSARQTAWTGERRSASALARVQDELTALRDVLADNAGQDRGLDHCLRRARSLVARLQLFSDGESSPGGGIRWVECSTRSFALHVSPTDYAATFRDCISRSPAAWIFTSATLAVGDDFGHFTARLGIEDADTACWDSPFDYAANTLCYLPAGMPEPNSRGHTAAVIAASLPVIEACGGGAFMLFTSRQHLREAARLLADDPPAFPVFVQDTLPHAELLARFREAGNGLLLATASFWEGVDVRGSALSCVIIDKLPFAAPDDPVSQARSALIRERGGNPFRDQVLPAAVIMLRQGAGRLIRDENDRGVLVLCDPRLRSRSYGRLFLSALPPMPRAERLDDVERFFESIAAGSEAPA
jgi:ATP-dependent DNA helicase DinG